MPETDKTIVKSILPLQKLPPEMTQKVGSYLTRKDKRSFSQTNQGIRAIVGKPLISLEIDLSSKDFSKLTKWKLYPLEVVLVSNHNYNIENELMDSVIASFKQCQAFDSLTIKSVQFSSDSLLKILAHSLSLKSLI